MAYKRKSNKKLEPIIIDEIKEEVVPEDNSISEVVAETIRSGRGFPRTSAACRVWIESVRVRESSGRQAHHMRRDRRECR